MAGAYYDSMLNHLAKWPASPAFKHLSIVQDPVPRIAPGNASMAFAQPIVFFSVEPISTLALSPLGAHITHLRFRVPSRSIWHQICVPHAFPRLRFLDMSTTLFSLEQALIAVVHAFPLLEHLVVDAFGLLVVGDGPWRTAGRSLAMAGIKKAREKEREMKARGDTLPATGRTQLSSTTPSQSSSDGLHISAAKFRILPAPPRLRSLGIAAPPTLSRQYSAEDRALWTTEFEEGWQEGISRLKEHRKQTRSFVAHSEARLLQFRSALLSVGADALGDELVDVNEPDGQHNLPDWTPPQLCFGCETDPTLIGVSERVVLTEHKEGCGHSIGSSIWKDFM